MKLTDVDPKVIEKNMNDAERRVLKVLRSRGPGALYNFAGLADRTGLTRDEVSRACNWLACYGLAEYRRSGVDLNGHYAGAGYCAIF